MTIEEILQEHNVPFVTEGQHHHARSGWVNVDCIQCGKDSQGYHLGINIESLYAVCWRCGYIPFLRVMSELTNSTPQQFKFAYGDLDFAIAENKLPANRKLELPKKLLPQLHSAHKKYLRSRGFDPDELVKLWGIKGIGVALHHQWSVWVPIFQNGVLCNWLTRSIAPDAPKRYSNASVTQVLVDRTNLLLGADYVRHAAVCVEGCFDAFAIGPGAVATLGTSYSREQVLLLSKIPVRCIAFDNEPEAQARAKQLCDELSCFEGTTTNILLESGKDAAVAESWEIKEIRRRFLND